MTELRGSFYRCPCRALKGEGLAYYCEEDRVADRPSPLSVLMAHGLRPSKKRGQHFLIDPNMTRKILAAIGATGDDVVVDVGAGLGALTSGLAESSGRVIAVEVDRGLAKILVDQYADCRNVTVEEADVLTLDLEQLARRFGAPRVKVVGNLPYCITAPILLWIVRQAPVISEAVIMVQAEVAERIVAAPGRKAYGPLTVAVQFWSMPEMLFRVSRGCFKPVPEVESALVRLRFSGRPMISVGDESFYFDVVRKVFTQRRKMLKNSLLQLEGVNEQTLRKIEAQTGLDLTRRPEELSLEEFAELAREIESRS